MEEKLTLLARFSKRRVEEEIIPHIEKNCLEYETVSKTAYAAFCESRFAENTMYLYNGPAHEKDVPIGQEYGYIAMLDERGNIRASSIQKCKTRVLCFFDKYRTLPQDSVWGGHSGLILIQFDDKIPEIINELNEIDRKKYIDYKTILCLYNEGLYSESLAE